MGSAARYRTAVAWFRSGSRRLCGMSKRRMTPSTMPRNGKSSNLFRKSLLVARGSLPSPPCRPPRRAIFSCAVSWTHAHARSKAGPAPSRYGPLYVGPVASTAPTVARGSLGSGASSREGARTRRDVCAVYKPPTRPASRTRPRPPAGRGSPLDSRCLSCMVSGVNAAPFPKFSLVGPCASRRSHSTGAVDRGELGSGVRDGP